MKGYKILTITHKHSSLKELAHFVLQNDDPSENQNQLQKIKDNLAIEELMYLATCNRVMFFFYADFPLEERFKQDFLKQVNPNLTDDQIELVSMFEGQQSIEHLYEVSASIDSMVVGEREILRQLRDAFETSKSWGLTGDKIRLAMKFTVQFAKQVYAQTRIGEKPISVVSLAVRKLLAYNLPKESRILLVGAGQTNTLVSKFLNKHEFKNVTVFNRSMPRAEHLAGLFKSEAFTLEALKIYDKGFDCLIVCTGATEAIIDTAIYQNLLQSDASEKVVIDLSMPNNVSREVVENFNLNYIEIEGLRALAQENLSFRENEISNVRLILDQSVSDFQHIYQVRMIEKAMHHVPSEIKAIKDHAINNVFKKEMETLDDNSKELLLKMMTYMEKRCISIPMQAAKNSLSLKGESPK